MLWNEDEHKHGLMMMMMKMMLVHGGAMIPAGVVEVLGPGPAAVIVVSLMLALEMVAERLGRTDEKAAGAVDLDGGDVRHRG